MEKILNGLLKYLFLIIMLLFPVSLYMLVEPSLTNIVNSTQQPELAYLNPVTRAITLVLTAIDGFGVIQLIFEWWDDLLFR